MATKSAILSVKIVSDAADFSKKMDGASKKVESFSDSAKKMAVPAAAIVAGIGTIAIASGKLASEAQQNFGAVDAVFKDHAKTVHDMAKGAAQNLGLSASQYEQYSALVGSQLKNLGTPMDQLVTKTDGVIKKAADLSAMFGGTVPEAVEAMSSAFKGEFDPIERYGIALSAKKIEAEAFALGFKKVNGAFADTAKQAAIMSIITKQSADSTGAFGREANTAAGQQARATAAWADAASTLGTALLPAMTELARIASEVATWVMNNQQLVQHLAVILGVMAGAVLVLVAAMTVMNIVAALNPFAILAVAVVALIALIVYVATQTGVFGELWSEVSFAASTAWNAMVTAVLAAWEGFWGFLRDSLVNIGTFFFMVFNAAGTLIRTVVSNIQNFFSTGFQAAKAAVQVAINSVNNIIQDMRNRASDVINGVKGFFSDAFNGAKGIVEGAINGITGAIDGISTAVQGAISWVQSLFNMSGVPGWLKDVLGMGGTGFEFTGAFAPAGAELGIGATGGFGGAPVFSRGSGPAVQAINVNVTVEATPGTDRVALGKEIAGILDTYSRATGRKN